MDTIFYLCVEIMVQVSGFLGITYQELNVLLFVIIHPLITLYLFLLYRKYKRRSLQISTMVSAGSKG